MSSSSSDNSDASDNERMQTSNKRTDSASDSDNLAKKKKSGRPAKNAIDSGDSSASDSEVEETRPVKKKVSAKRKRHSSGSDDDRVDDSLFQDAEDKARWKNLSELDKEREIFERMEARENQRARDEIAQQLKAKKEKEGKRAEKRKKMVSSDENSEKSAADSSDEDPEFHRPSDVHRKHKEKNAMAELKQKRKEIEKKNAKNASLSIDAIFGAESNGSSSSSSSSAASSRSSSRSSSRDSSPDGLRSAEEEKVVRKEVDSLEELVKARLSRFKLCKFVHAPFFKETAIGGFVRVGGQMGFIGASESKYKLWQVIDVEETGKIYDVDGKRTNKGLKCRFGKVIRVFRIAYVSNSEFTRTEFEEWLHNAKLENNVPTMDVIEKKEKDIKKAFEHKFSDKEVDSLIEEKRRFQKVPRNIAMTKAELIRKKAIAQQVGDLRESEKLQDEIDELEKHAAELDRQRSHDISGIALLNYRNRTSNKNEILSGAFKMEAISQDDPFTRKKGGMRVVSGSKGSIKTEGGAMSASSSSSNLAETAVKTEVKAETMSPEKKPKFASPIKEKRKSANMFDLHNSAASKLNFSIDIDKLLSTSKPPRDDSHLEHFSTAPNFDGKARGLSLADYRRRKAEGPSSSTA